MYLIYIYYTFTYIHCLYRFGNGTYEFFHYYQHYMRIIDAYHSKLEYETKQFMEAIYHSYRQVVNKSKIAELQAKQAQNNADIIRPAKANLWKCKLFGARWFLHINYQ